MTCTITRRQLLLAAAASPVLQGASTGPTICIFSKHLAQLDVNNLGKTAQQMGFSGVDLTVRDGGHVKPERAAIDLPRAFDSIQHHGLSIPMITTGLTSASDPTAHPILSTAAKLGIPRYKLGYFRYTGSDIESRLAEVKRSVSGLVALGRTTGIQAGYHNHSNNNVGEAVWDIRDIIQDMDSRWIGYYFDPCHATAEGGVYGWHVSLDLALPRLKMIAVKDFYWEKSGGKWKMQMCPLGQGMVQWPTVFERLSAVGYNGPVSLHLEYEPANEMQAIADDLETLKHLVTAAYSRKTQ